MAEVDTEYLRALASVDRFEAMLDQAADRALVHADEMHDGAPCIGGHYCPGDETLDDLHVLDHGELFVLAMAAVSMLAKTRKAARGG